MEQKRRQFIRVLLGALSATALGLNPLFTLIRHAYANAKRMILPQGTRMETLVSKNPGTLDTRNLEVTPVEEFGTMGETDYEPDMDRWRLHVTGRVKNPLELSYSEIKELPVVRRKVLLICPGFFALHGDWKGISMARLLQRAGVEDGATHVAFSGPERTLNKVERFPLEEVLEEKVFLAYGVNGETLPKKHGFPLRLVAEDHYGDQWVKYVYKMSVEGPGE